MKNKYETRDASFTRNWLGLMTVALLLSLSVAAQNRTIDSLKLLLNSKSGQGYYNVLCELGYQYLTSERYEEAIHCSTRLIDIGNRNKDSLQLSRGLAIKASVLRRTGLVDSAILLYNAVYPIVKRNNYENEFKDISNSLGLLFAYQGYYDKALKYLFESLAIRQLRGDKYDLSIIFQNIAFVYYKLDYVDKALSFFKEASELKRIIGDDNIDLMLINMSLCYIAKDDFVQAKKLIEKAFTLKHDAPDYFLMTAYFAQGSMNFFQSKFGNAQKDLLKSYAYAQTMGNTRFQLDNLVILSDISIQKNEVRLAATYLQDAEKIITEDSRYKAELMDVYTQFSTLYHNTKDYRKIVLYQDKLLALNSDIFNGQMTTNLMKAEAEYVEHEHKLKLESQGKILALNEEIIYRQKMVNIFIGIIALLMVALVILLARSNWRGRVMNQLLDKRVKERTHDLELHRDALQRAWQERDLMVNKTSTDIKKSVATMKGLCRVGIKDIDHPNAFKYLQMMNATLDQLVAVVGSLYSKNEMRP